MPNQKEDKMENYLIAILYYIIIRFGLRAVAVGRYPLI
jgi:hypothetical protein